MVEIPTLAQLPARPQRIIGHWTGGGPKASEYERKHYHYLVEQDGTIVPGVPVGLNMRNVGDGGPYAAHTGDFNSFSAGVAWCGMREAVQGRTHGDAPITAVQTGAGCAFIARLCRSWELQPNQDEFFTHAEAWRIHRVRGKRNHEKWDILVLPFHPTLGPDDVGPFLRQLVADHLRAGA